MEFSVFSAEICLNFMGVAVSGFRFQVSSRVSGIDWKLCPCFAALFEPYPV